jgi:DNA replication and repair protein RecF
MHLQRLTADGVRNLVEVELVPHRRLTVFEGENGQGKTNLLEAIHLAAALRPLRPLESAQDLVGFGRAQGVLHADFDADGPLDVDIVCEAKGRKALVCNKSVRDVGEIATRIGVVSFLPEDAVFIRGGPADRRRGLDRFAFGLLPGFASVARRFEEALARRNRVLKAPVVDGALLDSYTPPFAQAAAALTVQRRRALQLWSPAFQREAQAIGGDALSARLSYQSEVLERAQSDDSEHALAAHVEEALWAARNHELRRRSTAVGPHHDDVLLHYANKKARFLASQGEARALVLSLRLAAVRLYTEARAQGPLLLLDDVAGELDASRSALLLRAVDETGAQAFVTATSAELLPARGDCLVLSMAGGRLGPAALSTPPSPGS